MSRLRVHPESHLVSHIGWLRAAVLGANDGIVSTASLIVGVDDDFVANGSHSWRAILADTADLYLDATQVEFEHRNGALNAFDHAGRDRREE